MLIDIDARYSLREKIHAFIHRYRLPELPVRVSQGIYQSTGNAQSDFLVSRARAKCDKIPKLVVEGKCVEAKDVVEEFTFLNRHDGEFFVIVWSSGFGPDMLKRYQDSGLVVGDISKARTHTYNFLGKEGVQDFPYPQEKWTRSSQNRRTERRTDGSSPSLEAHSRERLSCALPHLFFCLYREEKHNQSHAASSGERE